MSLRINVAGGTGGGNKKPPAAAPKAWICDCIDNAGPRDRPGYLSNCPDCKKKRPE